MYQYIWQRPKWSNFAWDANRLLVIIAECRLRQGMLLSKISSLGFSIVEQTYADIMVEEVIKTSAIEGEPLDMRSVRSSVARKLGLPSAGLQVDRKIDSLVDVLLDATKNFDTPLTVERLYGWQASLFPTGYSGIHKILVGQWRGNDEPMRVVSGPVGRETIHYEAPPSTMIDSEIANFIDWWAVSHGKLEGLVRAAVAHFWFVTIHPFEDGNGRISRALTDMALAQDDKEPFRYYSLSSQIMADRDSYYSILERSQKGSSDITEWIVWFLECYLRAINRSEELLAKVFVKADFWRKHDQLSLSDRQKKVINRLLDAGPEGFEGGLTTRKYASMTKVSRPTAFREIDQLLELGIIKKNPGMGRSVSYNLVWDKMR